MGIVVYLILAVLAFAYFWVQKRFRFWRERGFLSPKSEFPFGSFEGVGQTSTWFETMDNIYKEFKGKTAAAGFFIFMDPNVLPIDPEVFKNILVRDFNSFHERGFYYNKEDDPLSAHMLSLEGQEWRERRVKLSPIFTSGKMKMMFEIIDSISDKLVNVFDKKADDSKTFNVKEWTGRFTADVIGNVAFGLECKCLDEENADFYRHGEKLSVLTSLQFVKFFFANAFPNLSRKLHITTLPKEQSDFFLSNFLQTIEYREKNNIKRNDFVSLLLGLKDFYTPTELAGESFIVFLGGSETSSILITFTCYELALNPEIQKRLHDEIKAGLNENDGKMTYEMLSEFKYLDMVINESLRKYPPIPAATRKCTKEYKIPGTDLIIPKGVQIQLAAYSLHHDPEHYPEPEKFDPERFNAENSKNRNPFTFLPFAEGPRNCIGMRFGLMQSKIAVAKLVSNFEILPTEKTPAKIKFVPSAPFLVPEGGMWLKFNKIE